MKRINRRRLIGLAFLGLIILRFILILNVYKNPNWVITVDSEQYVKLAENLLESGRYQSSDNPDLDFFRAPGYPAFLAVIMAFASDFLPVVVTVQFLLSLGCAWVVYVLGKSMHSERVGAISAFLLLISPNFLFWSTMLMTELLFSFGLILSFYWMIRSTRGNFPGWAPGLILGIITLLRPIGLYLILIWAIWYLVFLLQREVWQRVVQKISVFAIGALIVVVPWQMRNLITYGDFALSNVSSTTFKSYHLGLTLVDAEGISWEDAKLKIFEMGSTLNAVKQVVFSYPGSFIKTQIRGISRTIIGTDVKTWRLLSTNRSYQGSGFLEAVLTGNLPALRQSLSAITEHDNLSVFGFILWGSSYTVALFLLGVIGFVRGWRRFNRSSRTILLLGAISVLYLMISPGAAGEARFRVPIEPLLALFVGLCVINIKPAISRQKWI